MWKTVSTMRIPIKLGVHKLQPIDKSVFIDCELRMVFIFLKGFEDKTRQRPHVTHNVKIFTRFFTENVC